MLLTKGCQKIIVSLYEAQCFYDEMINIFPVHAKGTSIVSFPFSVPVSVLKAQIYKKRSTKIYEALNQLEKAGLVVTHKTAYANYTKDLRDFLISKYAKKKKHQMEHLKETLSQELKQEDPKKMRPFMRLLLESNSLSEEEIQNLKELLNMNDKKFKETIGYVRNSSQSLEEGIQFAKDSGLLWYPKYPNQRFVYLTPDGMFLGRILKRG